MYSILQSCVEFTCKIQMFCEVMFFIFYNVFNLTFTFWIRLPTYMKIQSTSLFINSKILCQYKISAIFHLRESMRLGHLQAHRSEERRVGKEGRVRLLMSDCNSKMDESLEREQVAT